jgi:prevent-host-death family protein
MPRISSKKQSKKGQSVATNQILSDEYIQSSIAKRHFGKYFQQAVNGQPVLINNKLINKSAVLVDADLFEEMAEIIAEINDEELNAQLQASHEEHERGEAERGIEGLIDIMNETIKKELMH